MNLNKPQERGLTVFIMHLSNLALEIVRLIIDYLFYIMSQALCYYLCMWMM